MRDLHICVSARPVARELELASDLADGIEVKLDWEHLERDLADRTLADHCQHLGVDLDTITSVHLPPGLNRRHGMSVAPGNIGTILDFVHRRLGEGIKPRFLTVHTVREFEYRQQLDRLATLRDQTDYRVALENTPDESYLYTPLDLVVFSTIAAQQRPNLDVAFVLDTGHLPIGRSSTTEYDLDRVYERLDDGLRESLQPHLDRQIETTRDAGEATTTIGGSWTAAYATLELVGDAVTAVHLNDPEDDGLPRLDSSPQPVLRAVLNYCIRNDISIILEPTDVAIEPIAATISNLRRMND